MTYYNKRKAIERQKAIEWQLNCAQCNYSYSELFDFQEYFYKVGKQYGLLKEFKNNGII